jgi:hypothetical protein
VLFIDPGHQKSMKQMFLFDEEHRIHLLQGFLFSASVCPAIPNSREQLPDILDISDSDTTRLLDERIQAVCSF